MEEDGNVLLSIYTIYAGILRNIGQWTVLEEVGDEVIKKFINFSDNNYISFLSTAPVRHNSDILPTLPIYNFYTAKRDKIVVIDFRYIQMMDMSLPIMKSDEIKGKKDTTIKKNKEKK